MHSDLIKHAATMYTKRKTKSDYTFRIPDPFLLHICSPKLVLN